MSTNQARKIDPESSRKSSNSHRDRKRAMGLVKKEVWVLPEQNDRLQELKEVFEKEQEAVA